MQPVSISHTSYSTVRGSIFGDSACPNNINNDSQRGGEPFCFSRSAGLDAVNISCRKRSLRCTANPTRRRLLLKSEVRRRRDRERHLTQIDIDVGGRLAVARECGSALLGGGGDGDAQLRESLI